MTLLLGLTRLTCSSAEKEAEWIRYESPKGSYRIQQSVDNEGQTPFIVSTKNPGERAPLPDASSENDRSECQVRFYSSPDEKWIFYTESWRHHGVLSRELYRKETGIKFAPVNGEGSFKKATQSYAIKNGGFKKADFLSERDSPYDHLGTKFRSWSFDSSRLLFGMFAEGSEHGPTYVYYNTRTKTLEQTRYLRELNRVAAKLVSNYATDVVCAEPTDPLPPETELKARFVALDEKLNKTYAAHRAPLSKEEADELREKQRAWVKLRDEGLRIYLRLTPKEEKERRRLQFLGDVTAARFEELTQATNAELQM